MFRHLFKLVRGFISGPYHLHVPCAAASTLRNQHFRMHKQHDDTEKHSSASADQRTSSEKDTEKGGKKSARIAGVPKRYILLFMIFIGFVNIYAMRVNLNVALVAMVNNQTIIRRGVKTIRV